jgi:hypothetical protein
MATGGGIILQKFYFQGQEWGVRGKRILIINAIDDPISSDSLDMKGRCVEIALPRWSSEVHQRNERLLWKWFKECAPLMLGAMYKTVQTVLQNLDLDAYYRNGRLNDLCIIGEASKLWPERNFVQAVEDNTYHRSVTMIREDKIGSLLIDLLARNIEVPHTGTSLEWSTTLNEYLDHKDKLSPEKFASYLRRHNEHLKRVGIYVEFLEHSNKGNPVSITYIPIEKEKEDSKDEKAVRIPTLNMYNHERFS